MKNIVYYSLIVSLCFLGFWIGFLIVDYSIDDRKITIDYSIKNYHFFFDKRAISTGILKSGWSQPEVWGVWSISEVASLSLPVKKTSIKNISLQFDIKIFKGGKAPQQIDILINGQHAKSWKYAKKRELHKRFIEFSLPKKPSSEHLKISFKISNPVSPKELKLSRDARRLGIGISQLNVTTTSWDPLHIIQ